MNETKSLCPVCGYDLKLTDLTSIVKWCPSCGFDFREITDENFPKNWRPFNYFTPDNFHVDVRRLVWSEAHFPWCGRVVGVPRPDNWDPIKQMHAIGVNRGDSFEQWEKNNPRITGENGPRFVEIALEKIRKLDWQPEVIEALWDGDTQGWGLDISVYTLPDASRDLAHKSSNILWLRAGGDWRLFQGTVPPWPEAHVGGYIGKELSRILNIPFYFPSPIEPDDDCPHYWDRDENRRCSVCGKYLSNEDTCYPCRMRQEKEKRDKAKKDKPS